MDARKCLEFRDVKFGEEVFFQMSFVCARYLCSESLLSTFFNKAGRSSELSKLDDYRTVSI